MENLQRKIYSCYECGKLSKKKEGLSRHKRTVHAMSKWRSNTRDATFTRKDNYQRHMKKHENAIVQTG